VLFRAPSAHRIVAFTLLSAFAMLSAGNEDLIAAFAKTFGSVSLVSYLSFPSPPSPD
jgi:hypothetical protein